MNDRFWPKRRRRIHLIAIFGMGAGLGIAACGPAPRRANPTPPPTTLTFRSGTVPESPPGAAHLKHPPRPSPDKGFRKDLNWLLIRQTSDLAGALHPGTKVDCPADMTGNTAGTYTCTVTYQGLAVSWEVEVAPRGAVVDLKTRTKTIAVDRDYVEDSLRYRNSTPDVECEMPEAALIPFDGVSPIVCRARSTKGAVSSYNVVGAQFFVKFQER
jgi:hypothetical protein